MPKAQIHYFTLQDETRRLDKLDWLRNNPLKTIDFERIIPDEKGNWLNITDNDFEDLLPLASKDVKGNKQGVEFDKAVFKLFSNGIVTARDEWSYDFNEKMLKNKASFFCNFYSKEQLRWKNSDKKVKTNDFVDRTIKFGSEIENHMVKGDSLQFLEEHISKCQFRPFVKSNIYFDNIYTHRTYQLIDIFGFDRKVNLAIAFLGIASSNPISTLVVSNIFDAGLLKQGNGLTQCLPLYRYDENGNRIENITDWGLEQFKAHYANTHGMTKGDAQSHAMSNTLTQSHAMSSSTPQSHAMSNITKEAIFHYVYAVLHNPEYRKKYEQNLKRDFPRIPFYDDFEQWASWGKTLMDLHIDYENAPLPPEGVCEVEHRAWVGEPAKKPEQSLMFQNTHGMTQSHAMSELPKALIPKTKLKADKINGTIELDEKTIIKGIPAEAWEYKLGNRSALEWVLDQYKESKPSDPTILEKFNTHRFADYKEQVIDLLQRVCTVSVETMKVVNEMNL